MRYPISPGFRTKLILPCTTDKLALLQLDRDF